MVFLCAFLKPTRNSCVFSYILLFRNSMSAYNKDHLPQKTATSRHGRLREHEHLPHLSIPSPHIHHHKDSILQFCLVRPAGIYPLRYFHRLQWLDHSMTMSQQTLHPLPPNRQTVTFINLVLVLCSIQVIFINLVLVLFNVQITFINRVLVPFNVQWRYLTMTQH